MQEVSHTKKVLIVGQHYWPETFRIADIAEGLIERGYDVDILCGTPNYPVGKFFNGYGIFINWRENHNGVRITRVPEIPRGSNTTVRISLNFLSFPLFSLFFVPFFLTKKYDRIIAYQLSPVFMSLSAILISKIAKIPLYFYICDFWPHSLFSMVRIKNKLLRRLVTNVSYWHYRNATGAMGVFKGIQERLVSEVGLPKDKTLYVAQAPEKVYESRVRDKNIEKRFAHNFNIMFAGNINPAQCFDIVTKAARIVIDRGYDKVHYIILGDGMSKKWLLEEVVRLGLKKYFSFEGLHPVTDIPKYQSVADALIVALAKSPLFEYGIPAKVYSYMPSGKPLIASMDGEGKNLINNLSKCGICVDSGDVEGLANAIEKMVIMPKSERLKLGENGYKYYKKHFDREYNLDRLEAFVFNETRIPDAEYPD